MLIFGVSFATNLAILPIVRKNTMAQAKINQDIGPRAQRGQLGPVEIFHPMGEPLRFSSNFAEALFWQKGKIRLKKPHRPLKIWSPKGPPNTKNLKMLIFGVLFATNLDILPIARKNTMTKAKINQDIGPWAQRGPTRPS